MKNSENRKFEESWRNAFRYAEADPSDSVWTNIDLQLSRAESGSMKRRVIFYQRLAAASIVFAIALSGLGIWYSSTNKTELLTQATQQQEIAQKVLEESNGEKNKNANTLADATRSSGNEQTSGSGELEKPNQQTTTRENKSGDQSGRQIISYAIGGSQPNQEMIAARHDSIRSEISLAGNDDDASLKKNNELPLNETVPVESKLKNEPLQEIPSALLLTEPLIAQAESKKKTNADENWWASLGGAAGSYNPNSTSSPAYANAIGSSSTTRQQSNRPEMGTSVSFGMNFGKKITPRLMLMSGFNFLTQSTEYKSSVAMLSSNNSAAFAADALSQASAVTAPTVPYTIGNVSEYVSIPFQAGYLFIDRKVGFQLNAGIASDFFLKNTLTDQSGNLLRYTQGAGDHSQYRAVNWTGLMGTEVSYKVAKHYRVSVVPGLRYSFNSVLKSTSGVTLNPMVWDVGFRFRYMF